MVRCTQQLNHTPALNILKRRGPDYIITQQIGDVFIAQTVLHITGTPDFYLEKRKDGFAYNGEIYNYKSFGPYTSDVVLAYNTAREAPNKFKEFRGPWAWCHVTYNRITYASDPQGEHKLYQYKDDNILIVCSDVAPILTYINPSQNIPPYTNKLWSMIKQTPWTGIERCEPGMLYANGRPTTYIDSIFQWGWGQFTYIKTIDEAVEEFDFIWNNTIKEMTPVQRPAISFSGGIDSTIIAKTLKNSELLTVDIIGKDPVVDELDGAKIRVTVEEWAQHCKDIINITKMPIQCWSDVGRWLVAKHSSSPIIFTGSGADALFGADVCKTYTKDLIKSHSLYSNDDYCGMWPRCLDAARGDPIVATGIMDYLYVLVGVDVVAMDRLSGHWGRQVRNPFLHPSIFKFALSLPWHFRVNKQCKIILRKYFQQITGKNTDPKRGFAGHANDSLPYFDIDVVSTGDRQADWKIIAQEIYKKYLYPPN